MFLRTFGISLALLFSCVGSTQAVPPWMLLNFKKIDADPNKSYDVTEKNGPWMIMAATFTGETAEKEARALVLDLRKNVHVNAYLHAKKFDYHERETGLGLTPEGRPKVMLYQKNKYENRSEYTEFAVLVGDFPAVDDAEAQKTLKEIKAAQPESMKSAKGLASVNLTKQIQKVSEGVTVQKNRPPLARAFMAPNPLIPEEYFRQKQGVDKFVLDMNKEVPYSLLNCQGKYTVQVATFKGAALIDQKKINDVEKRGLNLKTNLGKAADQAHTLTTALRSAKHKEEAYEFHDREQSIVTIGSFDSLGTRLPDGTLVLDPAIQRILNKYGVDKSAPAVDRLDPSKQGFRGQMIGNIVLDVTPTPIEVPRRSIAADYVRHN